MKEQLPSPDFNSFQYERPNQNWICGKAADGKACRIGPDANGRCRATYECQPALETKPGETKGRWRCTRTAECGGPCENGPLPDAICRRAIPKCVPVRSLRAKRKIFTISVAALTAGILLVGLCGPFRWRFVSPGSLSSQHSTEAFARMAGANGNCVVCHNSAHGGPATWLRAGFAAKPGPFQLRSLAATGPFGMTSIDQNCLRCHTGHSFHEPDVVRDSSCSDCHAEHQGPGPMRAPTDANCLSCHANSAVMEASFESGKKLPAAAFDFRPEQGRVLFKAPRPERGYTKLIHSFATDHPEFQIIADKLRDPDTLKFNHELHLASPDISPLLGRKLECADCHKPDAAGVYHLKITYEQNCKQCHSLQFDVHNPDLKLPHGDAGHVRAFLRSLPQQYADYARKKGITSQAEVETFAREQIQRLRADFGSGEELEQRVFFSDARSGPVAKIGGLGAVGAAKFPGCAYCHEVTPSQTGAPQIAKPVLPDRWMIRSEFDHSKHFKVACAACHDAVHSRETSDILLPSKQSCVQCHSPQGGVADSCSTCHSYHTPGREISMSR
jgi:doubled CXXCH motif protein